MYSYSGAKRPFQRTQKGRPRGSTKAARFFARQLELLPPSCFPLHNPSTRSGIRVPDRGRGSRNETPAPVSVENLTERLYVLVTRKVSATPDTKRGV